MNYYIEKDGNIVLYDNNKQQLLNTLPFFTGYEGIEVQETEREIIRRNDGFVFADEVAQELIQEAKNAKTQEATDKAYSFEEKDALITVNATNLKTRASGVYHIEGNLTNNIKMSAYASTLDDTTIVPWNTKENVNILLNKAACQTLTSLMSQLNAKLWTVDFPAYLAQIDACETVEEVNAINIEYQSPSEVVDININPPETQSGDHGESLSSDEAEVDVQ